MEQTNVVFRDQEKIDVTVNQFNEHKTALNEVIKQFKDLNIGEMLTREDMQAAISRPDEFIKTMVDRNVKDEDLPKIGMFKLKKSVVVDMLDLKERAGFINACHAAVGGVDPFARIGTIKKGKVAIDKKLLEVWIDRHSVYANTEAERKAAGVLLAITSNIQLMVNAGFNPSDFFSRRANGWLLSPNSREALVNIPSFKKLALAFEK